MKRLTFLSSPFILAVCVFTVLALIIVATAPDAAFALSALPTAMPTAYERIDIKIQDAAPAPAASTTAVFKCPIGRRYHEIQLVIGGTAPLLADIDEIRVKCNEKVIHRYSATELDAVNQFDGRAAWNASTNPVLVIPFERYNLENSVAEQETAIDTGPVVAKAPPGTVYRQVRSMTVELDINSGWPSDGTIKAYATQSLSLGMGAGTILHRTKDIRSVSGAGTDLEFFDLPFNSVTSQALNRVGIGVSTGTLSTLKIDRDQRTIFERTAALNTSIQTDGVRTPQSGWYFIDRTERGQVGNRINLVGVQDFRYKLSPSGAMTLTFLSEYLGGLGD